MNIDVLFVLELIAVVSGIVSVWLAKKESVLLYPIGSLSVIIWFYLCYNSNLFGQSLVNFFFLIMNIYGWYNWLRKKEDNSNFVNVSSNSFRDNLISIGAVVLLIPILYFGLKPFQAADNSLFFVLVEMFITAMNFVAMWLMAWKRIENWIFWIIADILCFSLFVYNEYYLSVVQFVFFIVIAFMGYYQSVSYTHLTLPTKA